MPRCFEDPLAIAALELPRGPCVDELSTVFSRDTLVSPRLFASPVNSSQQLDFPSNLFQRSVLRKLGNKLNNHFSVAHADNIPENQDSSNLNDLFFRFSTQPHRHHDVK